MAWYYDSPYPEYVSAAERRANAKAMIEELKREENLTLDPVELTGSKIASTFWGKAWCENLVSYGDYASRLPRGRSYVRNGAVIDLQISAGKLNARVLGTELYDVEIAITALDPKKWKALVGRCHGQIDSVVELLKGKLPKGVLEAFTEQGQGLFPAPREIKLSCSCPDSARMCKHVAATLYGVGARLDTRPELFFTLRQVKQEDLISKLSESTVAAPKPKAKKALAGADLSAIFGIELAAEPAKKKKTVVAAPAGRPPLRPSEVEAPRPKRKPARSRTRRTL